MNESLELFLIAILGYIFFLIEEFESNAAIPILSILASAVVTIVLSIFVFRRSTSYLAFACVVAVQLFLTAVLRVAFVYGGVATYLKGVDAFGMLGLNVGTYLVFAVSGLLPAYLIRRFDPGAGFRLFPIVFCSLGVLYSYKFAQGFWSPLSSVKGVILFVAEFTAPAVYALIGIWPARYWKRSWGKGYSPSSAKGTVHGDRAPNVPKDDSDKEILSCVLMNIYMRALAEKQAGRAAPPDDKTLGPMTESELRVIQDFRQARGYSYRQVESIFWCSDFIRSYHPLSLSAKRERLGQLTNEEFLDLVQRGTFSRGDGSQSDGIVHYLTFLAFQRLGLPSDEI